MSHVRDLGSGVVPLCEPARMEWVECVGRGVRTLFGQKWTRVAGLRSEFRDEPVVPKKKIEARQQSCFARQTSKGANGGEPELGVRLMTAHQVIHVQGAGSRLLSFLFL